MTVVLHPLQLDADAKSGFKTNDILVLQNFGANAQVHLDLGSVAARNGESLVSLEKFLKDRGQTQNDFSGKQLELVSAERVGLQHYTFYPKIPAQKPVVSEAKNLCVLVSYEAPPAIDLAQSKI